MVDSRIDMAARMRLAGRLKELVLCFWEDKICVAATAIGVPGPTMSNMVNSKLAVSAAVLAKIARALPELDMRWLITGDGQPFVGVLYDVDVARHVIVSGNPMEGGLTIYGLFVSDLIAARWAECNPITDLSGVPHWVALLEDPNPTEEEV